MERLTDEQLHQRFAQLGESLAQRGSILDRVMGQINKQQAPARPSRPWRIIMLLRPSRHAVAWAASAAAVVILGLAVVLPHFQTPSSPQNWWLQPSAAWAGEVTRSLDKAKAEGFACRGLNIWESPDGKQHTSSTTMESFYGRTSYRRNIFDDNTLREVQWYVPGKTHRLMISCRNDTRSFTILQAGDLPTEGNPIDRMKFMVGLIDKADQLLGQQEIEGHKCVGFQINASKYGDNPDTNVTRIWFDEKTKLPVKTELMRPSSHPSIVRTTMVEDQFDYHPELPDDVFLPRIPAGYVEIHADHLKTAEGSTVLTDEEVASRLERTTHKLSLGQAELQAVLESIGQSAEVPVVVNWSVLEDRGIAKSTKVTISAAEAKLGQILDSVLGQVDQSSDIGYAVRNGRVVVSVKTRSEMILPPKSDTLHSVD
jgi:hypothetical protein